MAAPKNPAPYKGEKLWREAIMRAVNRRLTKKDDKALEKLADKLVEEGMAGNVVALKEIGDRLDGKPAISATLDHSGDVGLTVQILRMGDEDNASK